MVSLWVNDDFTLSGSKSPLIKKKGPTTEVANPKGKEIDYSCGGASKDSMTISTLTPGKSPKKVRLSGGLLPISESC